MNQDIQKLIPNFKSANNISLSIELQKAFIHLYEYFDSKLNNLLSNNLVSKEDLTKFKSETSSLINGVLASPVLGMTGGTDSQLAGVSTESSTTSSQAANKVFASPDAVAGLPSFRSLVVGDISFTIPISLLDTKILKTDDDLTKIIAAAPYANDGYVTIKDNSGHSVKVGTVA